MRCVHLLVGLALSASAASASLELRGLTADLSRRLTAAKSFTCDGGAKRMTLAQLNDNYCDCEDGSDEPGTAACSHTAAVFHCQNAGFFPQDLPTSRVNDGICDCCDGSDEYASPVKCEETCGSLMKTFTEEKGGLLQVLEDGAKERAVMVEKAAELWQKDTVERDAVDAGVRSKEIMVEQVEARKAQEEALEKQERAKLVQEQTNELLTQLGLLELSPLQLGRIVLELASSVDNKDKLLDLIRREREAISSEGDIAKTPVEELEAAYRVRDEERKKETRRIEKLIKEREKEAEKKRKEQEEAAAEAGQVGDDGEKKEIKLSFDDIMENGEAAEEAKTEDKVDEEEEEELKLPEVEERPVDLLLKKLSNFDDHERPEAKQARDNLDEVQMELNNERESQRKLKERLEKDYGQDRVFYAVQGECVKSAPAGQYEYEICFYGDAKQDYTGLGHMVDPPSSTEIEFTKGDKCWNGPKRSIKVALECGTLPMELYEIDEPATCVYSAKLRTPIACDAAYRERLMSPNDGENSYKPHHIEVELTAEM